MNILIISDEDKKGKKLRYKEWSKITQKKISKIFKDEKEDNQSKSTEEQIIKRLENLWIKIDSYNIEELGKLTEEKIINLEKNQKRFENLWIEVDGYNIGTLSELTEEEIINLEKNQKRFENLW